MRYVCFNCKNEIGSEELGKRIRCPYCGGKILFKKRQERTKHIKSK